MVTATMSSKGQLVLPKAVRDAHDLRAGSELEIEDVGDAIILRPKRDRPGKSYSVDEVAGFIKHDGLSVSLEDMERAVADEATRKWNAERG